MIDEYGSNLFKSKFDPLSAFEAKSDLLSGKTSISKDIRDMEESKKKSMINLVQEEVETTHQTPVLITNCFP